MAHNKKNPVEHGQTLRPPNDTTDSSSGELMATSDLYSTIKNGTATLDSLKLLISGFDILEELGRGAFGVVYRARDEKLDRHVAIKISLLDDPALREQYVKEAKSAAKLDHPGIVPVYQVGTLAAGQPFVVQRLIDGTTLRKMLANTGPLAIHHACWLMTEIARAVAEAHAVGMIHRDLKPDNILVDSTGKPWVADFGLAIQEEDQREHRGEKAGTPLYMSPEQLQGRAEWLDGRADIYAMGIMLYEMLVGRTPYDARNLAELEEQVLHREPKPLSQRSPNIPAVMDIIFQNCCAKKVNDRYSNAYELVADLESVLAQIPEADTQVGVQSKVHGISAISRKSNRVGISTRRKTLRTTIREEPGVKKARRYAVPLILFGLTVGGAYWLWPRGGDILQPAITSAQQSQNLSQSEVVGPKAQPQRPFRVSSGGGGTHTSIGEAIAMAEDMEEITILPGIYRESLSIDRNVKLVGEGLRDQIVIVGENRSALTITRDVSVGLANLTLDGNKTGDKEFNTIDVLAGELSLFKCNVNSRSYDCIKALPKSRLKALDCNFLSMAHPAIVATETLMLDIDLCNFVIKPLTLEEKSIPVGVQGIKCGGRIQRCHFAGSGSAIGIQWESAETLVAIEDSIFETCENGIILQDCRNVEIKGSSPVKLVGCSKNGILLERCAALLTNIEIKGTRAEKGIRVIDFGELPEEPRVSITDCDISGFDVSLSVEHANVSVNVLTTTTSITAGIHVANESKLKLKGSNVSKGEITGILIEDAFASLETCIIANNLHAGVIIDGLGEVLNCVDCAFQDNLSGLLIYSGGAHLRGGEFQRNTVGVMVISRLELQQSPHRDHPIDLDFEGVAILAEKDIDIGMQIRKPCSIRFVGGSFSDPKNNNKPKIVGDLRTEEIGEITLYKSSSP